MDVGDDCVGLIDGALEGAAVGSCVGVAVAIGSVELPPPHTQHAVRAWMLSADT